MIDYTELRVAGADMTNYIRAFAQEYGVELSIDFSISEGFLVKAWFPQYGNRAAIAYTRRLDILDALMELDRQVRKHIQPSHKTEE